MGLVTSKYLVGGMSWRGLGCERSCDLRRLLTLWRFAVVEESLRRKKIERRRGRSEAAMDDGG